MKRSIALALIIGLVTILNAGPVKGAEPAVVTLEAPSKVVADSLFVVKVNVGQIDGFDAAVYSINYDSSVFLAENTTPSAGLVGGQAVPVDAWSIAPDFNSISIVQNMPGLTGISGSGYLATLRFRVVGVFGTSSNITLVNGSLSDNLSNEIIATWGKTTVGVLAIKGDANGDGRLNAQDITKLERIMVALDPFYAGADANLDSNLNALDITKLERMLIGLP